MTGRSDDAREAMDDRVEAAVKAEQVRWQERLEFLQREYGVDGGGCDSGDPLDFTEDEVRQALASARAAGAAEAFERAAKKCDERKVFYDGLAQQSYAEAEDDAESEGAPPDTTDGEFYEEKAGVCFQLAAAIRALAGEERK